jgi:TPR repeat protein
MSYLDHLHNGLLSVMGRPATQLARASELAAQGSHRAAYPLFVKAAKAGLPAAAGELGRAYLFGHGVPRCLTEALRWLTWAASAGEVAAQTLLADLALQGISRTTTTGFFDAVSEHTKDMPDYDQALKWARRAALGGSSEAKALLGFILTAGPAQVRDQEQGEDFYQQAAETGNPFGQLGWALILLRRNTAVAVGKARGLLEAAASAGLATAHYMLGIIAESGVAGAQDFLVAAEHYRAGAELGHHSADMVGDLYTRSGFLPPNYVEAAIWFRRAAEAGHTGSARKLGQLHLSGAGVVRDPEEAALWFRKAAARGNADAMVDLAQLALTRQISGADRQTILAWFQQKAETGDLAAIFNLGICLAEGIGTRRDDPQALALFRRAAKCMPIAQYWYGRMLAEGRGTAPDLQSARTWFLKAAEQHNADAEAAAGEMLFNGRGGPPDRSMAMALFMRAAAAGQPGAVFALEVLRRSEPNGASGGQCLAA